MSVNETWRVYAGDGSTVRQRGVPLPAMPHPEAREAPGGYRAPPGLTDAVNVSLALGQPLLVTGEPGTGKTRLAHSVAHELSLGVPLVFNTKTTSTARDLFYRYDVLGHFHAAQFIRLQDAGAEPLTAHPFIEFTALGLAILRVADPARVRPYLPAGFAGVTSRRSVVLIDEIDKAPRDLPNDILHEIDRMAFEVRETGERFEAPQDERPIVIFTSNSEKNLPEAFLRRCVFFHIDFPTGPRLREIVRSRMGPEMELDAQQRSLVENALRHFESLRALPLSRKPATAELLDWLEMLRTHRIDLGRLSPGETDAVAFTYSILAKTAEDVKLMLGVQPPRTGG